MRSAGYYSLDDLDYAIFESNGKLSAKEKIDYDRKRTALPVLLIGEGKIIKKNLALIGKDEKWVRDRVKDKGVNKIKDVGVMTIDGSGKVYFQKENEKYDTFFIKLKGEEIW